MSTILPYSERYHPPAPVFDVFMAQPDSNDWHGPFQAELDSGADLSIVPLVIIRDLAVPVFDEVTLMSQWRDRHSMNLFQVDMQIAGIILPVIAVAGDARSSEILLGRNVLNRLDLRLEGPKLRTHILGG